MALIVNVFFLKYWIIQVSCNGFFTTLVTLSDRSCSLGFNCTIRWGWRCWSGIVDDKVGFLKSHTAVPSCYVATLFVHSTTPWQDCRTTWWDFWRSCLHTFFFLVKYSVKTDVCICISYRWFALLSLSPKGTGRWNVFGWKANIWPAQFIAMEDHYDDGLGYQPTL